MERRASVATGLQLLLIINRNCSVSFQLASHCHWWPWMPE